LRVSQTREDYGSISMMSMQVDMPTLRADRSPELWCERTGGPEVKPRLQLKSRRPRWNKRMRTLILDFHGRCSKASVQNFQLDLATGDESRKAPRGEPEVLFGRTGADRFVLDYRSPLGMAQAFAIALTTNPWQ
jgi:hypothetical protein